MFDTINGIPVHPLVVHAVVVLLSLAVCVGMHRLARGSDKSDGPPAAFLGRLAGGRAGTVVAGLTLVTAVASGVQVYRVGDSGARAAWGQASHGASAAGQVPGR